MAGKKKSVSKSSGKSYKVFVSSTFLDNKERRRTVEDSITMAGMVWHGMEFFEASTRPVVEECLRHAREADVLVGIIAHRYGWEPDGMKSITEMEYDAVKERLMFLIDPELPVNQQKDYDEGSDKWKKQEKLEAFKQKISRDQIPAVFNETTLGAKVLDSLNKWRAKREEVSGKERHLQAGEEVSPPELQTDKEILSYCRKAEALHENLPVAGFAMQIKVPIDLEEMYVPLRAMVNLQGVREDFFRDAEHAEKRLRGQDAGLEISLLEAFRQSGNRRQRGIVILGDPGSGKTTHLKRLLLWCLRKDQETIGLPHDMIPVFLPLRQLKSLDQGLDAFIEEQLQGAHLNTSKGFGRRLLERQNLLFLLDGLDEVADLAGREKVAGWITEAIRVHSACRFVVTCRFAGYSPTVQLGEEFLEMHIRPLTEDQVARFIRNWYTIVERGLARDTDQATVIAAEKAESLINRLKEPDFRARRVFELTRNPLLLANICLVHRHRGALPKKRACLYEECVNVLLEHWREAKGLSVGVTARDGMRVLQPVALWLHGKEGRTRAEYSELIPIIEPVLRSVQWSGGTAREFLNTVRDESGLLTGWNPEEYGFMHLGFQEYLAAREIRTRAFHDEGVLRELASHFGESWWQEVGLILLALEDPSLFVPYLREVVKQPAFAEYTELIEASLDDAAETSTKPFIELLETEPGKDEELWERQLVALRVLERLDPEAVHNREAHLKKHPSQKIRGWIEERAVQAGQDVIVSEPGGYELVKIPGGVFTMGSPDREKGRSEAEGPVHQVQIQDFYLGRYPVTNEEYGRFLKENPEVKEPKYWADRQFNQPRQPVVGVSWDDAVRYAEWTGLRLPSEAEWEYACRAGGKTRYCNGDAEKDLDRVGWYDKNSGELLHPVGEKEPNAFGLYDMHGNVYEWVEDDWHGDYKGAPNDGKAWTDKPRGSFRVIRGGSWGDDAQRCRSALRGGLGPGARGNFVGFRLSRSV
ncbi:MAG: SUMF1/EgtB/PvdO family nonheme iron enzyme [Candidatus Scalindua sp.]|nr:SUMF1/EgtB/PvdO family nonheme iron enzyme [Candidatus Scalindua sp.]